MQQKEDDANEKGPVVLGRVNLSFYAVVGAVVQKILERLGHEVEVREGSHPDIIRCSQRARWTCCVPPGSRTPTKSIGIATKTT